ncbi:MAG: hypothetical protein IJQ98_09980, partial [Oscillospiraceae bacterium]|nr:hypothetical protein [Oscillospiraceae bacterium]
IVNKWQNNFHRHAGTAQAVRDIVWEPQYLAFMDEFYSEMGGISAEYDAYKSGERLTCEDGANIDRRNVGMSRVAGLLGKKDLVAHARPMMLIKNGVAVSGTFMQTADGVDLTKTTADDPIRGFTEDNFDSPEVFDDIAAMQGLDFICGNLDRHPGNFFMRFNPPKSKDGKLSGITLIDNDMSFGDTGPKEKKGYSFVMPEEMGVIGEDFVTAMEALTKDQLRAALADCGISEQELDRAWERKEALQAKIAEDRKFFADKAPGYTEKGRLRVVPKAEWSKYSIKTLAKTHEGSQFSAIVDAPNAALHYERRRVQAAQRKQESETVRREALGLPPEVKQPAREIPQGRVVGSGLAQERDPLNVARPDTLKLATPGISKISPVGNCLSQRYPISWKEGGEVHNGFLTPELSINSEKAINKVFDVAMKRNPQYANALRTFKDYYSFSQSDEASADLPRFDKIPWENIGLDNTEIETLKKDPAFKDVWHGVWVDSGNAIQSNLMYMIAGVENGRRIDLRNVAMSDVGDVLGVPNLLARSRTVQLETDGRVINGVVMEAADGFESRRVKDGEPMARITAEQASEVYNTQSGLKSMADMQILDFVCMNRDRHDGNMFYKFEGLEEGKPRFVGVVGIDNDYSFGTEVPAADQKVNNLAKLNDMQVISESMASRLKQPGIKEMISQKLIQNGLGEEEIDAAMKRIDAVNAHVDDGKLRVVKDGDWGKGQNTIEALSGDENNTSIFHIVKSAVIDPMAERAEKWNALPEEQKIPPERGPGLKFTGCAKVDDFGQSLKDNTELEQLREQARLDLNKQIAENAELKDAPEPMSEKDALANILAQSKAMVKSLAAADPLFHGRSAQYRDLRGSANELARLAQRLSEQLQNPDDELSTDDRQKLSDALNKVTDRSAAYQMKKMSDAENGMEISKLSEQKMKAAGDASFQISRLRAPFDRTVSAREAQKNPMSYVHNRLNRSQAELSGATGMELRRKTAETIYLKAITQSGMSFKKGAAIHTALRADIVAKNRDEIMRHPAFERLAKMPDDELRSLAAQRKGDKLMDRFVGEAAKDIKAQKTQEPMRVRKAPEKTAGQNLGMEPV